MIIPPQIIAFIDPAWHVAFVRVYGGGGYIAMNYLRQTVKLYWRHIYVALEYCRLLNRALLMNPEPIVIGAT